MNPVGHRGHSLAVTMMWPNQPHPPKIPSLYWVCQSSEVERGDLTFSSARVSSCNGIAIIFPSWNYSVAVVVLRISRRAETGERSDVTWPTAPPTTKNMLVCQIESEIDPVNISCDSQECVSFLSSFYAVSENHMKLHFVFDNLVILGHFMQRYWVLQL